MTMKAKLMACLMAFSVALAGYISCLLASHIRWSGGMVSAPALLPGLGFGLAMAAWLLRRGSIGRGKAVGLALGSAVAYFAAYWTAVYTFAFCGKGMIFSARLSLFHTGIIAGLVGTALLIASLAAISADFRRKEWKTLILLGAVAGGGLCLAGIGASSGDHAGSLANPGDRVFIFVWQLLVSGYVGMLLLAGPGSTKPTERGRTAHWATRAVFALLMVSFVQAAIGYSRRDQESKAASPPTSGNSNAQPSTLAAGDAATWANSYRNAKFITRAEFLKKVGPVHLVIRQGSGVSECVRNLEDIVRRSASEHGWTLAPAPTAVELVVDADIDRSKITTTEYTTFGPSEREGYFMVCNVYVQVGLLMKVTCRRGDKFVQLNAYPSRSWNEYSGCMGDLANFETEYPKAFRYAVDGAFDAAAKLTDADDTDNEAAWNASLWPASRNADLHANFQSPITSEPGGSDHAFYGLTKYEAEIELLDDAANALNISSLRESWISELSRNGHELNPSSEVRIQHHFAVSLTKCGALGGTRCYADLSALRVWQNNVVFLFNGELRRGKVCLWSDCESAIALPRDYGNTARDLMTRSIRSAARELALRR